MTHPDTSARLRPLLHDLLGAIVAPTQVWSRPSGDITGDALGVIHCDVQVVSGCRVEVPGWSLSPLQHELRTDGARFAGILRPLNHEESSDPTVRIDRVRTLAAGRVQDEILVTSVLPEPVTLELVVEIDPAATPLDRIRVGAPPSPVTADVSGCTAAWEGESTSTRLSVTGGTLSTTGTGLRVTATLALEPSRPVGLSFELDVHNDRGPVREASRRSDGGVGWRVPATADPALRAWAEQSLADLSNLRMTTRELPGEEFIAAGAPWYLTLFGRDSLWTARMLLPILPELATSTLRVLAHFQGRTSVPETMEDPGKILHELRGEEFATLPPRYYGTVDATCLWICLLHDAWVAGLPEAELAALVPHLNRALDWLGDHADPDGDGFLEYASHAGGLANQGWKDSEDSIRFSDGRIATGPVALCEVQGYAHEAAIGAAELLEHVDADGAEGWRAWATELKEAFRQRFWPIDRSRGPALALAGDKRPVDSLTSNIGHLLGTGILAPQEERQVADLLTRPDMLSDLGLRTMSAADGGYNPLSYHCGSVWAHDTGIVIRGMLAAGLPEHAATLARTLRSAAYAFGNRLPELWSGEGRAVPYPAACRPQAWSAAAFAPALQALQPRS